MELVSINRDYPDIVLSKDSPSFSQNVVHENSSFIWPHDAPSVFQVQCAGDGNCLYRSVSLLCTGSQDYHLEFRCRTVCELVLHSDFYLTEDKCSILLTENTQKPIRNVLPATSRSYFNHSTCGKHISRMCFEDDVKESCRPGTYANMWEVYGVCSVFGIPLRAIYPQFNTRHRTAFHRLVQPRSSCAN